MTALPTGNNLFPTIWAERISAYMQALSPVLQVVDDRSALVSANGEAIRISVSNANRTPAAYTRGGDVTIQSISPTSVLLELNQPYADAWAMDLLDIQEVPVDYVGHETRKSYLALIDNMTDYITGQMKNMIGSSTGDLHSSMQNIISVVKTGTAAGSGKVNYNTSGYRALLVDAIMEAQEASLREGWFDLGEPYILVSPAINRQLNSYLTIDKPNLGVGMLVDDAWSGAGMGRGKLAGFTYKVDPRLNRTQVWTSAGTQAEPIYFGIVGQFNTFARNVMRADTFQRAEKFELGMKFVWQYGFKNASAFNDRGAYVIHHTITAS